MEEAVIQYSLGAQQTWAVRIDLFILRRCNFSAIPVGSFILLPSLFLAPLFLLLHHGPLVSLQVVDCIVDGLPEKYILIIHLSSNKNQLCFNT